MFRAEPVRMMLHYIGLKWEDVRCNMDDFKKLKRDEKLDFGSMPMLEMDGKRLTQTTAIINYVGGKAGLQPTDPLVKHRCEKIVAWWSGDFVGPHIYGTFSKAKDADKPAVIKKMCADVIPAAFMKLVKLMGGMKFICGDCISSYDFQVAGFFTNTVFNPKSKCNPILKECFDKCAPSQLKAYIQNFMCDPKVANYLQNRAKNYPDVKDML